MFTFLLAAFAAVVNASNPSLKTVDLGYAKYQSDVSLAEGVTSFLGVRYAAPPTGASYAHICVTIGAQDLL